MMGKPQEKNNQNYDQKRGPDGKFIPKATQTKNGSGQIREQSFNTHENQTLTSDIVASGGLAEVGEQSGERQETTPKDHHFSELGFEEKVANWADEVEYCSEVRTESTERVSADEKIAAKLGKTQTTVVKQIMNENEPKPLPSKREVLLQVGTLAERIAMARNTKRKVIEGGQKYWDSISTKEQFVFMNTLKDAHQVLVNFRIKDDAYGIISSDEEDISCSESESYGTLYSDFDSVGTTSTKEPDGESLNGLGASSPNSAYNVLDKRPVSGTPAAVGDDVNETNASNESDRAAMDGAHEATPNEAAQFTNLNDGAKNKADTKDNTCTAENANKPSPDKALFVSMFKDNRRFTPELQLKQIEVEDNFQIEAKEERDVTKTFGHCLIGYIAGRFPGLKGLASTCDKWGVKYSIHPHLSGWTIFKFENEEDLVKVLEGGPYNVFGMPLLLKRRPNGFAFGNVEISKVPVWVNLPSLPFECWTTDILSKIASKIGKPIAVDKMTYTMERISYARLFVEVDASKDLVDYVKFRLRDGTPIEQYVHYEYKPKFCETCRSIGHKKEGCKYDGSFTIAKKNRWQTDVRQPGTHNKVLGNQVGTSKQGAMDAQSNRPRTAWHVGAGSMQQGVQDAGAPDLVSQGSLAEPSSTQRTNADAITVGMVTRQVQQKIAGSGTASTNCTQAVVNERHGAKNAGLNSAIAKPQAARGGNRKQRSATTSPTNRLRDKGIASSNPFEALDDYCDEVEDEVPGHFEQCINLAMEKKKRHRKGAPLKGPS